MRRGEKAKTCPDCGKKGVAMRWCRVSGDFWSCRYCDWHAYTMHPDRVDVEQLERLKQVNPAEES